MRISILAFLLFLVFGCVASKDETPAEIAARRLPLELCNIDGIEEPLLCGTFSAPEDWDDPEGPKIDISVIVVPAADGNPANQAWTEHQGGPGRVGLSSVGFFLKTETGQAFRATRDIVLFDQRGAGESGGLYCEALRTPILEAYYTAEKIARCREEMTAAGVRLQNYSTLAAVDDLEGIRKWLGYEQFDVGGWSYGSRFLLTYAQRYPDSIRTMMVALPTIFDYRRPLDWPRFSEDAIEGLFADCAAQPECNEAFPDLRNDLATLLETLEAQPVEVEYFNPVTETTARAELNRSRMVDEIHAALLRVRSSRLLPLVIHEAAKGNYEPFLLLAVPVRAPRPIAEAQYLSIVCPEETAFFTTEEAETASAGTFMGLQLANEFKESCAVWGLPPHPDYPLKWVEQPIPTLVISGDRDPITPIEYGERITASLSNARHLKIHHMPHDFLGLEGASCLDYVLLEFLEKKSPNDVDVSCVSEMRAPPFLVSMPE